ncbi:hypothetical protein VT84_17255 [Gemmata sp. SH-PL17]|uniref:hypothetical protein n=1 Tax=Gemmata sp. SH-PL17 TaxID=1630693 RepID=UPI00078B381A|nr:hypothetical protein [Gemmata sp. SH-PL17]AMV26149.1 hypothetical protein VT84_17255 [Gemmata sp. SH-PL17]
MEPAARYQTGQRWVFAPAVAEFEDTLVIGGVSDARPKWGWNERTYTVYVRYSSAAKELIPADYDGIILSLTDAAMDRSVTELVESGVELPWWWVYGRRFDSRDEAPNTRGVLSCDRVSDVLPHTFLKAKTRAEDIRARATALRQHREKFGALTARPAPSKTVAESWKRISVWTAEHAPDLDFSPSPGAPEEAITEFERRSERSYLTTSKNRFECMTGAGGFHRITVS